ncbi:MAG TPA: hypothetical protein DIT98_13205 [Verrucomicrobiales bacterium]|nr:hypothetical protein [Verrucomicrobiales bacterium]
MQGESVCHVMHYFNPTQSVCWSKGPRFFFKVFLLAVCLLGYSLSAQLSLPRLTHFFPVEGEPGTIVTLTGTGFQTADSILFGVGSASFEVISDTQIRAVVPSDATTGPLTVNTSRGFAASNDFFQVAPRIIFFEPGYGKAGDVITLRGANFSGLLQVWVGGNLAVFQTVGETQLAVTVPSDASTGVIRVVSLAGQVESDAEFQVIGPEPFILDFDPVMAPPGELIVIRGAQLSNATQVLFTGDKEGLFSAVGDTQIIVRVPAGADSGPVKITAPEGQGESEMDFLVSGAGPFITGLNPSKGQAGDTIIVEGVNLSDVKEISLNGAVVHFQVVANTQLSLSIPAGVTSGFIRLVTALDAYTSDIVLTVKGAGPVIESFAPSSGLPGAQVQFQGQHFANVESVLFGEWEASFEAAAETQLTALVPMDAETGFITIKTAFGEFVSDSVFVIQKPTPTITSFSPTSGQVGTRVTLTGNHFNGVSSVLLGDKEAAFQIVADSQILITVPADGMTGSLRVESPSGDSETESLFYLPASIDSFEPLKAIPGSELMIQGANFTGASKVRIGGKEAEILSVSLNEIVATVSSDALTGTVSVTTPAGSLATQHVFGVLPFIQGMTPVAGPIGTILQVMGMGFSEVKTVLIGELAVPFSVQSDGLIEIIVPSNAPSGQVTVINPAGLSISPDSFQLRMAADLSLEVMPLANPSSWKIPNVFSIKVHNAGPSTVRNFFLQHIVPSGSELVASSNPNGATEFAGSQVTSGIVSLEAGGTAHIIHTITTPHFGYEPHVFQIDTQIFDPSSVDQRIELNQPVLGPSIRLTIGHMDKRTHRLSWHPDLRGFELRAGSALSNPVSWSKLLSPLPLGESFMEFEHSEMNIFYILEPMAAGP